MQRRTRLDNRPVRKSSAASLSGDGVILQVVHAVGLIAMLRASRTLARVVEVNLPMALRAAAVGARSKAVALALATGAAADGDFRRRPHGLRTREPPQAYDSRCGMRCRPYKAGCLRLGRGDNDLRQPSRRRFRTAVCTKMDLTLATASHNLLPSLLMSSHSPG